MNVEINSFQFIFIEFIIQLLYLTPYLTNIPHDFPQYPKITLTGSFAHLSGKGMVHSMVFWQSGAYCRQKK